MLRNDLLRKKKHNYCQVKFYLKRKSRLPMYKIYEQLFDPHLVGTMATVAPPPTHPRHPDRPVSVTNMKMVTLAYKAKIGSA